MKKELSYLETLQMINDVKRYFESQLEKRLQLIKVPSPLFLTKSSGLQDQLSGVEQAVSFTRGNETFEVVHSLAKWKREALARYDFPVYHGLYTNMKAIRQGETVDELHSIYVEQWDWERIITEEDRTIEYLKETAKQIYKAIRQTSIFMKQKYRFLTLSLPKIVFFITSQELEDLYQDENPQDREYLITKEKKVVFIMKIGDKLKSGKEHDLRSPDYDDWTLNGDLLIYDKQIDQVIEITSMGIRVNQQTLKKQLEKSDCMDRVKEPYCKKILENKLPYTIGGGIGESRILLLLLEKEHIAEIQASAWENETYIALKDKKIL